MSAFDKYLFSHKVSKCKTANKSTKAVDDGDCDDGINMAMGSDLNDDTTPLLASTPKTANSNGKSLHRFFGNCVKNNFFNIAKEAPKCLSSNNPYMQLRPQLHTTHRQLSSELREKILEMSKRSSASDETNELTHEDQETTRSKQDDDEVKNRANYYEVSKSNKICYQQLSLATCAPLKLQNDFVDKMKSASGGEVNNATFVISQNTIELNYKANDRNDERIKQKPQNANSVKRMKWTINDDNNFDFVDDKEKCGSMNHSKNGKDIGTVATDIQPIKERINFFNKLTNNYKDIKSKFIKQSTVNKLQKTTQFENPLYQKSNHLATNTSKICSTTTNMDNSNDKQKSTIKALAKKIQNLTEEANRSSHPNGGKNSQLCYMRQNAFMPSSASSCNGIKPREHTEARILNSVKPVRLRIAEYERLISMKC
ncbi:bottleneck [Glossina fuscipes fuscipes]